jgi:hypothetical protein
MDNFDNDFKGYDKQPNHEINSRYGRHNRDDYQGRRFNDDTEFATDFMTNDMIDGNSTSGALIAGGLGMAVGVVALFAYSFVLGAIGIGLGLFAVAKGNKIIGFITIGIGVIAVATMLFSNGPFMSMF